MRHWLAIGVFLTAAVTTACSSSDGHERAEDGRVYKPFVVMAPGEPLAEMDEKVLFLSEADCEAWIKKKMDTELERAKNKGTSKVEIDRFNAMETGCLQVQVVHTQKLRKPAKPSSWDD